MQNPLALLVLETGSVKLPGRPMQREMRLRVTDGCRVLHAAMLVMVHSMPRPLQYRLVGSEMVIYLAGEVARVSW